MLSMGHKVNTLVAWRICEMQQKVRLCWTKQNTPKHTLRHWHLFQTVLKSNYSLNSKKKAKTWRHWTSINRLKSSMFVHFYTLNKHSFTIQQWFNINCKMHLNIVTHKHNQASNLTICHLSISFYFVLSKLG
jgi:hypothetical protein